MASSSENNEPPEKRNIPSGMDIISSLPDEVLVHILSFLPTKDAFKTSILSSRWENLWTVVPNLDFCPNNCTSADNDPRYMAFIKRILRSHNSSINKFQIKCNGTVDGYHLKGWVATVVNRNVRHIDIFRPVRRFRMNNHRFRMNDMHFPKCLFTCKTIVTLKIRHFGELDVPESIHFPCLKVFHLSIASPSNDLTQKLFCSSPVLEILDVDVTDESGDLIYNISSPRLKKLHLRITSVNVENFNSMFHVDTPLLEYLEVFHIGCPRYILKDSSALVKADVRLNFSPFRNQGLENYLGNNSLVENLVMLLNSFSSVKHLQLWGRLPMAVFSSVLNIKWRVFASVTHLKLLTADDFDSLSFSRWPLFPNVTHLELQVDKDFAFKNLADFLALAPKLVSLVFLKASFPINPKQFECSEQRVLTCLRSCLREIEVHYIDGLESELNQIKYLLMNAQVLEKMTVRFSDGINISQPLKVEEWKLDIEMMPRCSNRAQLMFI